MKLIEDFRVRYHRGMIILLLPLIPYTLLLGDFIYSRTAGGILFFYFTALGAFINRYIKVLASDYAAKNMGYKTVLELKRIHPRSLPQGSMETSHVIRKSISPILWLMFQQGVCFGLSMLLKNDYMVNLSIGISILTLMTLWGDMSMIYKALYYKGQVFHYETGTLKIYRRV